MGRSTTSPRPDARANEDEVVLRLDELIEPYGGLGALKREHQSSNLFVTNEIEELRGMGMIAPTIFLAVAAFLLHVVISRMIGTQREQIAALKAFGYSKLDVGWHYFKLVLLVNGDRRGALDRFVGAYLGSESDRDVHGLLPLSRFYVSAGMEGAAARVGRQRRRRRL